MMNTVHLSKPRPIHYVRAQSVDLCSTHILSRQLQQYCWREEINDSIALAAWENPWWNDVWGSTMINDHDWLRWSGSGPYKRAFSRRSSVSGGGGSSYDGSIKKLAFLPNCKQHHARVASSVRSGSITQQVCSKHSSSNNNHYGSKKNSGSHHQSRRRNHQQRHSQHQHPSSSSSSVTLFAPYRRRHSLSSDL